MKSVISSAILAIALFASSAFAQFDTAYIPVGVTNTNAKVRIVPVVPDGDFKGDSAEVTANQQAVLTLIAPTGAFSQALRGQNQAVAPAIANYNGGTVSVSLHPEAFAFADIEIHSINGKRMLRGRLARTRELSTEISRSKLPPGAYTLYVRGVQQNAFAQRFNHIGGRITVRASYGDEERLTRRAQALTGGWELTASATGYIAKTNSIVPTRGRDNQLQAITLVRRGTPASKDALQFFRDENIRLGWNLGNTLDAVDTKTNLAREGAWSAPAATLNLINGLAAQGVNIVRIPVSWNGHIGDAPDYTISSARLSRVQEVVDWVLGAGMKAVINIHHDGNYTKPPNTWGFLKFAEVMRGDAENEQVMEQIRAVWTQIATRFRDYGPELIFETFNEVHSGNWGSADNEPKPMYDDYSYEAEQDRLFEWNTAALRAIRATGGNNMTRYIAVPALGSTEPSYVISAHERGKLLPSDGGNGTSRLIVSVHFYAPWRYTVADATGQTGQNLLHRISQEELDNVEVQAQSINETFIANGIAAYYGEWGAPTHTRASLSADTRNLHVEYIRRVAAATTANGIVPIIWDDGGNFRILNRTNGNPATGLYTDVWNAYKNAVQRDAAPAAEGGL